MPFRAPSPPPVTSDPMLPLRREMELAKRQPTALLVDEAFARQARRVRPWSFGTANPWMVVPLLAAMLLVTRLHLHEVWTYPLTFLGVVLTIVIAYRAKRRAFERRAMETMAELDRARVEGGMARPRVAASLDAPSTSSMEPAESDAVSEEGTAPGPALRR